MSVAMFDTYTDRTTSHEKMGGCKLIMTQIAEDECASLKTQVKGRIEQINISDDVDVDVDKSCDTNSDTKNGLKALSTVLVSELVSQLLSTSTSTSSEIFICSIRPLT